MPSTHLMSHFHLVFSTKERRALIRPEWRNDLHAYMGGIVKGLEGVPLAVGGVEDHMHLLVGLKSKHRLDYFLRDLKADSSTWIHRQHTRMFEWQKGYGAFAVCGRERELIRKYIHNQEAHHQNETFKREYVRLLEENEVSYEEQYLW